MEGAIIWPGVNVALITRAHSNMAWQFICDSVPMTQSFVPHSTGVLTTTCSKNRVFVLHWCCNVVSTLLGCGWKSSYLCFPDICRQGVLYITGTH